MSDADFATIELGVRTYRRLVIFVVITAVISVGSRSAWRIMDPDSRSTVALVMVIAGLALGAMCAVTAHRLAEITGAESPGLYALACFLPLVSLVALISLASRASAWARAHGLKVGIAGPSLESLETLRRERTPT